MVSYANLMFLIRKHGIYFHRAYNFICHIEKKTVNDMHLLRGEERRWVLEFLTSCQLALQICCCMHGHAQCHRMVNLRLLKKMNISCYWSIFIFQNRHFGICSTYFSKFKITRKLNIGNATKLVTLVKILRLIFICNYRKFANL